MTLDESQELERLRRELDALKVKVAKLDQFKRVVCVIAVVLGFCPALLMTIRGMENMRSSTPWYIYFGIYWVVWMLLAVLIIVIKNAYFGQEQPKS